VPAELEARGDHHSFEFFAGLFALKSFLGKSWHVFAELRCFELRISDLAFAAGFAVHRFGAIYLLRVNLRRRVWQ
jgi:hypothetical protein